MKTKRVFSMVNTCVVLSLLSTIGCIKSDHSNLPSPNPLPNVAQLKRIDEDQYTHLDLQYSNKVITKWTRTAYLGSMDYAFTYNKQGNPITAVLWGTYKYNFLYNGGLLTRLEYSSGSTPGIFDGYYTFAYANDRLKLITSYYTQGNSYLENGKAAYTYYPNGNVKTIADSTLSTIPHRFVLEKRTDYEYDTQPNPLRAAGDEVFYTVNMNPTPHNVTKEEVYDEKNQLTQTKSYQYQYTNNLPIKAIETITAPGKPTITKTINYTY